VIFCRGESSCILCILLSSSSYPTRSIIAHTTCMWFSFFLQGRDMHCERMRAPREIHKSIVVYHGWICGDELAWFRSKHLAANRWGACVPRARKPKKRNLHERATWNKSRTVGCRKFLPLLPSPSTGERPNLLERPNRRVFFTHRSGWSLHYRVLRITTSALKQRRRRVPRAEFSVATRESWLKKNLWRVLFGRI
jgi:hypothetical protein